ncbi:tyrosine-type recombinase/integrase [Pseudomonas sp. XS1P51]
MDTSIYEWMWPVAPATLSLYDKYSDTTYIISADEDKWRFSYNGYPESIVFASGSVGALQRRLAMLTSGRLSLACLHRAARLLVRNWESVSKLLTTSAEELKEAWDEHVTDARFSAVMKGLLKMACDAEVGPWSRRALSVVRSLETYANTGMARRKSLLVSRQNLVNTSLQADIVRLLDASAWNTHIEPEHLEGAVALALIYQHGVRPVQVLCLDVEHVKFFKDANDESACIVSFHAAKQRDEQQFEIVRQVKPEWVPMVERLWEAATTAGRKRLFKAPNSSVLWKRARALCELYSVDLNCTAPQLRNTAAQALADAGHSRQSIGKFLGHVYAHTASVYIHASMQQVDLINTALGASKLYTKIQRIASGEFVSLDELLGAEEDQQIGGVVGSSLLAGLGLCQSGQSHCVYNPVTSCYGCAKFLPSLEKEPHLEAVEGMRQQVRMFLAIGIAAESPAYLQLTRALSGAQQTLDVIDQVIEGKKNGRS